jgi:co-chaperonin GroES (HSP10)
MEWKSTNGYLLIEPLEEGEQVRGNIIIPDTGVEKPYEGVVVSNSEYYNYNTNEWVCPHIEVGEIVKAPRMGSWRLTIDNKEYFVCKSTDVLLVSKK